MLSVGERDPTILTFGSGAARRTRLSISKCVKYKFDLSTGRPHLPLLNHTDALAKLFERLLSGEYTATAGPKSLDHHRSVAAIKQKAEREPK